MWSVRASDSGGSCRHESGCWQMLPKMGDGEAQPPTPAKTLLVK